MAKSSPKKDPNDKSDQLLQNLPADMPAEAKEKLKKIKVKLDKFKDQILKKNQKHIMGIALLPPGKEEKDKDKINTLVLIDEAQNPVELKEKLHKEFESVAKGIDKNLVIDTMMITELWQSCYDAKYDLIEMIAVSAPIYDKGMLAAVKISEVHKSMVLKKFEKYIVSYVLAGSLTQGRATHKSDIDVFIVIDDTDVKRMTRVELKDKLRAIIIGMGVDAGKMTGIENKINIQVYILTDFWEFIKEANPIIFTFLRDGVPFYDRGIFMPWKQLLKMGKIKPSPEAIDIFLQTGAQMMERIGLKIRDIGMEDTFYAILTPSQAAIMLYGLPPPTPKETPEVLRDVFVKKEKLLEDSYVKMLEKQIQTRKDLEHGDKKELTGKELQELVDNADKYLKRIKKLFSQIEELKEKEGVLHAYESALTVIRDILYLQGSRDVGEKDIPATFKKELVNTGKIPEKYLRTFKTILRAKEYREQNKLTQSERHKVTKDSTEFLKHMVEYLQRLRGMELERSRIRVKYGSKYGEVLLLDQEAFVIMDIDTEQKEISKGKVDKQGRLQDMKQSSLEEFEHAIARAKLPQRTYIKEPIFEDLKLIFGKEVEILLSN